MLINTNRTPYKSLLQFLFGLLFFLIYNFQSFAQQTDKVDFLSVDAIITPNADQKSVKGVLEYSFKILKDTDSIFLDGKGMQILGYEKNGMEVIAKDKKIWLVSNFKRDSIYNLGFSYVAEPSQALYFFGDEIWTQGQGKYTSHWLPSLDDTKDKIIFNLTIAAFPDKKVIANGKLEKVETDPNYVYWMYKMEHPMSSYLVAFSIGVFNKKTLNSNSGIEIDLYYKPEDSLKLEPTYRHSKRIFDFLEKEIGVAFPWENYKQVPVRDFLYAGMENTSATFFSQAFMVDSIGFNDRNFIKVNAHELAHQWFGDMVTAETDKDHWLQEGFATYYALLAEREIFGEDYFYWQLYQSAEQLKELSDAGKGESLLNPQASSLTFYQKGAWALQILRERIGEKAFKNAIQNYLNKYKYGTATTDDFLNEVKKVSEFDISNFEESWLKQSAFQSEDAFAFLMKSDFIKSYIEIAALRSVPLKDKRPNLQKALQLSNDFIGQEVVHQLTNEPINERLDLYKKALESKNLYIRQSVALSLEIIPQSLEKEYLNLLNDNSYVTKEAVMYQIWTQLSKNRVQCLEETNGIVGFQNKNIRQLWLVLALLTENYPDAEKVKYLIELKGYTSQDYSFEIRELAFNYINDLHIWDFTTLADLVEGTVHPNWRFAKSCKELLKKIIEGQEYNTEIKSLSGNLSPKANELLSTLIKKK